MQNYLLVIVFAINIKETYYLLFFTTNNERRDEISLTVIDFSEGEIVSTSFLK